MVVEARLTRSGVFGYTRPDGTVQKEYRPPNQVFDSGSMNTFCMRPVTNDHPPTMLDSTNTRQYAIGMSGQTIKRDGDWMVGTLAIFDSETIKAMDAGEKRQVSNGYDAELELTPGVTPDGEHYDAIQTNIIGNHIAIVKTARAGKDAAIRMDAASTEFEATSVSRKDSVMTPEELQKIAEQTARHKMDAEAAKAALEDLKKKYDAACAERDAAVEAKKAADKARNDAEAGQPAKIKARVQLEASASRFLRNDAGEAEDFTGMADRAIKLAVIKHVTDADCDKDPAGQPRSDSYVDARYDAALERASESADTFRAVNELADAGRTDAGGALAKEMAKTDKAREDMVKANREGWRGAGTQADNK